MLSVSYFLLLRVMSILSPLSKLNTVIQLKKKVSQFKKCWQYVKVLKEETSTKLYFDMHYYKYSYFLKFSSLISHMILDVSLGVLLLYLLHVYTSELL